VYVVCKALLIGPYATNAQLRTILSSYFILEQLAESEIKFKAGKILENACTGWPTRYAAIRAISHHINALSPRDLKFDRSTSWS